MIRKFYEADHGYDNSGPSQPSGGKSAEEILMKHEWLPGGGWTKQNMLAAMEEYASQYAHQQPVQGYSREQMEECFAEGVNAGMLLSDLPTPRTRFNDFIASQQPVNDGWVRVKERIKALENWKPKKQ